MIRSRKQLINLNSRGTKLITVLLATVYKFKKSLCQVIQHSTYITTYENLLLGMMVELRLMMFLNTHFQDLVIKVYRSTVATSNTRIKEVELLTYKLQAWR